MEHLLHVGTLAKSLLGGNVVLSTRAKEILHKLCLYHAIGGHLSPAKEELEYNVATCLKRLTKLDRRLLDTRIVSELLRQDNADSSMEADIVDLINHYITSAIVFLRNSQHVDRDLRDVVTLLIQVQDRPQMFVAAHRNFNESGLTGERNEIASVFACFKAAQESRQRALAVETNADLTLAFTELRISPRQSRPNRGLPVHTRLHDRLAAAGRH